MTPSMSQRPRLESQMPYLCKVEGGTVGGWNGHEGRGGLHGESWGTWGDPWRVMEDVGGSIELYWGEPEMLYQNVKPKRPIMMYIESAPKMEWTNESRISKPEIWLLVLQKLS